MEWRLLSGVPEADVQRVLASSRRSSYQPGETVFAEGEPGTALHLLESGHVAIRVGTATGEVATLTVAAPGDAFGEMALLRRSSLRTATAVALDSVTTLAVESAVFARLRAEHPSVERLLVAILAARVSRLSGHLVDALYLPVDKRLVRRLLELSRVYAEPGTRRVVIPLTQEDLAGLTGTTRPTVNALLRSLQDSGLIALSRGRVEILDVALLAAGAA
jgi:CRP-like cAMP-binding protein